MTDSAARPTRVRHLIVFITFLVALVLYLHRFCLSYAQRYLKEDLGLDNDQLGWCFSAFFFAYALAQVPSGWFSDRFGARRTLAIYIAAWSFFTAMMGFTAGFAMLLLLRIAVGVSQAGAYPTAASLLSRWVPFASRGRANSLVAFGGRVGGFSAPLLTAYLVIAFVPVSVSSSLREADLLDPHCLAFQLENAQQEANAAAEKQKVVSGKDALRVQLLEMLNQPTAIQVLAERYGATLKKYEASHKLEEREAVGDIEVRRLLPADDENAAILRNALNEIIVSKRLQNEFDLTELKLEQEAKALRKKPSLTDEQQQRLNRLILESASPESIRKIYVFGWRPVMFIYGALGLLVIVLYLFVFRDRPADHPWCNEAEQKLIEQGRPTVNSNKPVGGVPFGKMLRSRSLWLMCVNQACGTLGWAFLMTWLPRYLDQVWDTPYLQRGWMAAVPLSVGWIGMLLGGYLTDRITNRYGLRWRMATVVVGRFAAGLAYVSVIFAPSAWTATAAFALVAFSNDLCNPAGWSFKQDVGGRYVGAILGWSNMWGNFGAALSPVLLQFVIKNYDWDKAFLVAAGAFFIASLASLGVDARQVIDQE